jgi:tRNA A58 N-methylase Trm61|tara:strand:+ start:1779 stop:2336 length:558 start_codon:yes stop_codon:yes gene_type:complete
MYTFLKDKILDERNHEVMMDWETPIMEEHARIVTKNGGDILEIGFGMGICSDFIQQANIKSHTIIEIHDQVFDRLLEWAKDKPNVIPIKGDWFNSIPNKKYNGIMHDTWEDKNYHNFIPIVKNYLKSKGIITYYNPDLEHITKNQFKDTSSKLTVTKINVNPPTKNMNYKYFDRKDYYCIEIVVD